MKDLIILGNGMAGMTAALYAKRANLDFKIVGKDEFDFGQIGNAILVENYPCVESQSGFDLAMKLHDQLEENGIKIEEHEVLKVNKLKNGDFQIDYVDGKSEEARTIIYALGATPRQLNCEIDEGIPIHYCALCDGPLYKNKAAVIIGGGDAAFTQAEYLSKICSDVIILMCDENITAASSIVTRIKKCNNVRIYMNAPVKKIERAVDNKIAIFTEQVEEQEFGEASVRERVFAIDGGVFVAIGMKPNTAPLEGLLPCTTNGYIDCWDDSLLSMYVSRLYVAGDVRTKKVRQGITAAADGAIVVQSVIDHLKKIRSDFNGI